MKTNEFKTAVLKLGASVEVITSNKKADALDIKFNGNEVGIVYLDHTALQLSNSKIAFDIGSNYGQIVSLMFEYTRTPIREREEEKVYWLIFPKGMTQRRAIFKGESVDILSTEEFKTSYTQKEIDAMPKSWQDFFIKVEVK